MNREIFGRGKKTVGKVPAVALMNPKYSRNVSQVVRACSCFGIEQCWFTGDRVPLELEGLSRLPREERMKGYSDVDIIHYDYLFEQFPDCTPIGVEILDGAEMLTTFEHPENALYVFGPEDGSLPKIARSFCHRYVFIPTRHCTNLAAAAHIVLYDRALKKALNGAENPMKVSDVLDEPRGWGQFEDKYYGDSSGSHQKVSVSHMLGVNKKV